MPELLYSATAAADRTPGGRRVVASTDTLDRNGRVVEQNWELDAYHANPVLLWGHDSDRLPIGQARARVARHGTGRRLEAELQFDEGHEFAREVAAAWDRGLLNMVSVGWVPVEWADVEDVFDEKTGHYRHTVYPHNELLELSVVDIGANPDAKRLAASLNLERELTHLVRGPQRPAARDRSVATARHRINRARLDAVLGRN